MEPNWDDVPDVTVDGRSMVPFPDPAPELTAAMWDRWRADRAARRKAVAPQPEDGDEDASSPFKGWEYPVITKPAEEFDEPCSSLGGWVKLAHASGWTLVELAHAFSTAKGKPFATGNKAGTIRGDRNMEIQWLKIEKAGVGRAVIAYPLNNGKTEGTRVYRSFNGQRYNDADMRKIVKGE